jgi:hypothetical protein
VEKSLKNFLGLVLNMLQLLRHKYIPFFKKCQISNMFITEMDYKLFRYI